MKTVQFCTKKKFLISLLFFSFVTSVYLFFNPTWYFNAETLGTATKIKHIAYTKNYWLSFSNGNINHGYLFTFLDKRRGLTSQKKSYSEQKISFFDRGLYYRPIYYLTLALLFNLFKYNPYPYFIITILLHSFCASLLLLTLLYLFSSYSLSISLACMFAFHSSLLNWLGLMDCQQNQWSLFFLLISLLFLFIFFKSKNYFSLFFTSLFFALSLFTREVYIIFPLVIILLTILKDRVQQVKLWPIFISFFIPVLLYLGTRMYFYPLTNQLFYTVLTTEHVAELQQKNIIHFLIYFFYNMFWRIWFTIYTHYPFIAAKKLFVYNAIRFFILSITSIALITNTKKKQVMIFTLITLILLWPMISSGRLCHRFQYEGLPFMIIGLGYLFFHSAFWKNRFTKILIICSLTLLNSVSAWRILRSQQRLLHLDQHQDFPNFIRFKEETKNLDTNLPMVVMNLPEQNIQYCAGGIEFYDQSFARNYYYELNNTIKGNLENANKYLTYSINKKSLQISSHDLSQVWFSNNNEQTSAVVNLTLDQEEKSEPSFNRILITIFNKQTNTLIIHQLNKNSAFPVPFESSERAYSSP